MENSTEAVAMNFYVKELSLPGVLQISYDSYIDHRGQISTTFDKRLAQILGNVVRQPFHHDKFVLNKKNVLRGIHYDTKTSKLVTCLNGHISQYVICIDEGSPWFGKWELVEMRPMQSMVLIPSGYGNAFISREDDSIYHYKLAYEGDYSDAGQQFTVKWNDPRFKIPWNGSDFILSARDV